MRQGLGFTQPEVPFSFTPGFSQVTAVGIAIGNRLNGFLPISRLLATGLKPGVNEKNRECIAPNFFEAKP